MLLSHAGLFAQARTYLCALADTASGFDASLEYEASCFTSTTSTLVRSRRPASGGHPLSASGLLTAFVLEDVPLPVLVAY